MSGWPRGGGRDRAQRSGRDESGSRRQPLRGFAAAVRRPVALAAMGALLVAVALAAVRMAGGIGPAEREAPAQGGIQRRTEPGTHLYGVTVVGRYRGERQWQLTSDRISELDEKGQVAIENVRSGTLFREGEPFARLEGGSGLWRRATGDLELEGPLVLTRLAGGTFEASRLLWNAGSQRLVSPDPVRFRVDGQVVEAGRLELDLRSQRAELTGGVVVQGTGGSRLEAERVVYLVEEGKLQVFGAARVVIPVEGFNG